MTRRLPFSVAALVAILGIASFQGASAQPAAPEPASAPDYGTDVSSPDVIGLKINGRQSLAARMVPGATFSFSPERGNPEPGRTKITVSADAVVLTHGIGEIPPCGHRHEAPAAQASIELASNGRIVARSAVATEPHWRHLVASYTTKGVDEVMTVRMVLGFAERQEMMSHFAGARCEPLTVDTFARAAITVPRVVIAPS